MSEQLSLGEFVQLLAAKLQQLQIPMPFQNERPWHELFFELKRNAEMRGKVSFLEGLRFDWNGPYPKSQELAVFLHALHCNASATVGNPSYSIISLPTEVANLWRQKYTAPDLGTEEVIQEALKKARIKFTSSPASSYAIA
jgi:hypothetical protein